MTTETGQNGRQVLYQKGDIHTKNAALLILPKGRQTTRACLCKHYNERPLEKSWMVNFMNSLNYYHFPFGETSEMQVTFYRWIQIKDLIYSTYS